MKERNCLVQFIIETNSWINLKYYHIFAMKQIWVFQTNQKWEVLSFLLLFNVIQAGFSKITVAKFKKIAKSRSITVNINWTCSVREANGLLLHGCQPVDLSQ